MSYQNRFDSCLWCNTLVPVEPIPLADDDMGWQAMGLSHKLDCPWVGQKSILSHSGTRLTPEPQPATSDATLRRSAPNSAILIESRD